MAPVWKRKSNKLQQEFPRRRSQVHIQWPSSIASMKKTFRLIAALPLVDNNRIIVRHFYPRFLSQMIHTFLFNSTCGRKQHGHVGRIRSILFWIDAQMWVNSILKRMKQFQPMLTWAFNNVCGQVLKRVVYLSMIKTIGRQGCFRPPSLVGQQRELLLQKQPTIRHLLDRPMKRQEQQHRPTVHSTIKVKRIGGEKHWGLG